MPNLMVEWKACPGRRYAAYEWSTKRRTVQATVQRQR
jgi:hypothetical protein